MRLGGYVATLGLALLVLFGAPKSAQAQTSAFDYPRLCRDTAAAPLVQAAIDPRAINIWSERQARRAGRWEQYSFGSRRIDVRLNDETSLFHGLIHRTLDLIGESMWKYHDLSPDADYEHWLIYYTLELHWPGAQRRQGEPSAAKLRRAIEYWSARPEEYARLNAKAAKLASISWCANQQAALARP
jgi:hypothetical protein